MALLSGAKRKAEGSSTEGGSSDAALLTSPRASPAKSRARHEEQEKKEEEEEASNRVSPPPHDVEMQDPPRDEGAVNVAVGALDVPAIEEVRTIEVPAIGAERARADSTKEVRAPQAKEEAEEDEDEKGDGTVSIKLVESAKIARDLSR